MCSRKSGTFKSDTGKERVRFDHFFDLPVYIHLFPVQFWLLRPSSISVSKQSFASAIAASVVFPPAQEVAPLRLHALASK